MKILLILLTTLFSLQSFGQKKKIGTINIVSDFYQGKLVHLQGGVFPDSYGFNSFEFADSVNVIMKSVKIIEFNAGISKIDFLTDYPHPIQISYLDTTTQLGSSSNVFFIDNDRVSIRIGDLTKSKKVLTGKVSKLNKEYLNLNKIYEKAIAPSDSIIYDFPLKLDVLKKYVSKHPNSYVALWDIALNYGTVYIENDRRKVLEISQLFSEKIKNTKTFEALVNNIINDLELVKGASMPNLFFNEYDRVLEVANQNKYTLIDFWFSGCQPCLDQFGTYKDIYARHKQNGFEIIGISTDGEDKVGKWKQVISKFEINWINYLDTNGIRTENLFIRKFPTNFLIDKNGKILEKDISPTELDLYLKEHI